MTDDEFPEPLKEITPKTRRRNIILAVLLAAAAAFMYVSIFYKIGG